MAPSSQELEPPANPGRFTCYKTTIKIERLTEQALGVEEPVNQTYPICKDSENKSRKSSKEDGPTWKNFLVKRN
jgi:hypothetical protein